MQAGRQQFREAPAFTQGHHAAAGPARIGPNAIIQVAAAARALIGEERTQRLFRAAALESCLWSPPTGMVDEADVSRLHRHLRESLDPEVGRSCLLHAGALTGDYLLAHRIPRPVQVLLRSLPAAASSRLLLAAIRRHAWTFAGSGTFTAEAGRTVRLTINGNPLCRDAVSDVPLCHYYAATFERLFRELVSARTTATETACEACGAAACRFELRW
jgi:divinyl protochlorophyllide a 8-vinyl-reductase